MGMITVIIPGRRLSGPRISGIVAFASWEGTDVSQRSGNVASTAGAWSPATTVGQLIVAAALGTVGVPAFADDAGSLGGLVPPSTVWLAAATALVLWLLALAPGLDRTIRAILARAPWGSARRSPRPRGTSIVDAGGMAFLLVTLFEVVLIEATLRRPLAIVLAGAGLPASVDAMVAVASVVVVIALLIPLHQASRAFVQAGAWYALDALLATSGAEARPDDAVAPRRPPRNVATPAAPARPAPAPVADVATVTAPTVADPSSRTATTLPAEPWAGGPAVVETAPTVVDDATWTDEATQSDPRPSDRPAGH
jgi:hypothetical protein